MIFMMKRESISTKNAPGVVGPYSQGIKSGGLLFISGQLPIDMATGEFAATIGEQTRCCLLNLQAIAKEAGTSLQNAVKLTVFLTDMDDFAEMNSAYTKFFPETPPARSTIAVAGLPKNAPIEIEAICAVES
jgi:2-iminobutanoate/2-iminopropanoate deaminase